MDYAGDKVHSESLQGFISDDWVSEVIGAPQALAVHICTVKADRLPARSNGMVPLTAGPMRKVLTFYAWKSEIFLHYFVFFFFFL